MQRPNSFTRDGAGGWWVKGSFDEGDEITIVRKDGTRSTVIVKEIMMRDEYGNYLATFTNVRDEK